MPKHTAARRARRGKAKQPATGISPNAESTMESSFAELSPKALVALKEINKVLMRKSIRKILEDNNDYFNLHYTAREAVSFFETGKYLGLKCREGAFLPRVFRHLMVQAHKLGAATAVQNFSNNPKYLRMLDEAWGLTRVPASMQMPK